MDDFFKSRHFKILALLLALVFAFTLRAAHTGTAIPMISQVTAWLLTPLQRGSAQLTYSIEAALTEYFSGPRLADENDRLRTENAGLRSRLVEYERLKAENDQLKNYLEIKEKNPDFDFEPAMVIGRDAADRFFWFTFDTGSSDGVAENDPVITQEGLVGVVQEVGITHSKVLTVLDVMVEVGTINTGTREIGVTTGELALAEQGLLRLSYLPRESNAKAGDLIATTGVGGLFPRELVIGTIKEIFPDSQGVSLYAVISPPADIRTVRDVLVIKHFEGQASAEK